jgi:transposase-like protein
MTKQQGWMLAPAVAKLLGIKTSTLRKWRQLGRGPRGWKQTTPTTVHYPVEGVNAFLQAWAKEDDDLGT